MPSWLRELLPGPWCERAVALVGPPVARLAMTTNRAIRRRELAARLSAGELVGVDQVNTAVVALLEAHALPAAATLHVVSNTPDEFAIAFVTGMLRGLAAHDVRLSAVTTSPGSSELPAVLSLAGGVVGPSRPPASTDVILGLRDNGPLDDDAAWLDRRVTALGLSPASRLPSGDTLGRALFVPRQSHLGVLHAPLREHWPMRLFAIGPDALAGSIEVALPQGLCAQWELGDLVAPEPFPTLLGGLDATAAARDCSLGVGMAAIVPAADEARWQALFRAWNEPLFRLGRITA